MTESAQTAMEELNQSSATSQGAGKSTTRRGRSSKSTKTREVSSFGQDRFINRETSWLEFNSRVLEEAANPKHPLLERLRFLAISGSNLDEFYMVRVAGLRGMIRSGVNARSIDGLTAAEQIDAVNARARSLLEEQGKIWDALQLELKDNGISVLESNDLTKADRTWLKRYFREEIWPILTPLAVDPAHPFPFIANLGFGVAAQLSGPDNQSLTALVLVPKGAPRFVSLPGRKSTNGHYETRYVAIETIISEFMDDLFPDFAVDAIGAFRVIRDTDIEVQEEAEDLVSFFETALKKRDKGALVFLIVEASMPKPLRDFVFDALEADEDDIAYMDGLLGLKDLSKLIPKDRPDLLFEPYQPRSPQRVRDYGGDIFAAIRAKDLLVHHPYETFDTVIDFLRKAARDPNVVAIKQTLYRTSDGSPIVKALCEAAEAGKNVTAIVELKARFDEENNIGVARDLEAAGVQVVYGFITYKTHAKLSLVIRREHDGLRSYTHVGTGNYHPQTATLYTDLSLFTVDPGAARDAGKVFNFITGYAPPRQLEHFSMAPHSLKSDLIKLIETEASNARAGKPAMIWAKMNSLTHSEVIDAFYRASQAGVPIYLVVRGVCCLRPGVPGLSETIKVKSIVGRFLEHARIYCFAAGHEMPSEKNVVLISSADLMPRNLDRRVEIASPLFTETVHNQALNQIMHANINDECQSWYLNADASYTRLDASKLDDPFCAHEYFMKTPSLSGLGAAQDAAPKVRFDHIGPRC